MGPYYWLMHFVGVPAWVSQRLWFGSILLFAALGHALPVPHAARAADPVSSSRTLVFMLSPYMIDFASRLSVILLPWAGLPLMLALVIRALRDDGWKYPALFAIVVQVVGSVNATALVFAGIVPALWVLVRVAGDARGRLAARRHHRREDRGCSRCSRRCGGSSACRSRAAYGLDILKFTETLETVSHASLPSRGAPRPRLLVLLRPRQDRPLDRARASGTRRTSGCSR